MTETDELKILLKELSKKDIKLLVEAWRDCINQGYLDVFPAISRKTFDKELSIEDYEEYILEKEEAIEDRYAKYWRMMFELNKNNFDNKNITKKLYRSLLEESLDRFSIELNERKMERKRCYIFSNQYLHGMNHSPTLIVDKIRRSLINYLDEIYVISSTPYPYPYPDNNFQAFNFSGIEENTVYTLEKKVYLIEFRGFPSESMYFDFINNQELTNEDLFILVGHSSIHFDILPFTRKVYFPTVYFVSSLSTAKNIVLSENKKYQNIFDKEMNRLSATNDLTVASDIEYSPKDIDEKEDICIAIIGNRLDMELEKVFFEQLDIMYKKNKRLKFVIIGKFDSKYLIPKTLHDRIEYFSYIENLSEFLGKNIHFYLNPKRLGGGQSAIISINVNVPVLTLKNCDVYNNLYKKYGFDSFDKIIEFIDDYINDKNFKERIDTFNKEIQNLNEINFNKSIEEIISIEG